MRTIIAGSRQGITQEDVEDALNQAPFAVTTVLSGTAKGVDRIGEILAEENSWPIEYYPSNWAVYGRRAGFLRNQEMAEKAEALIAVWNGKSKGTKHMIELAQEKRLKVFIHIPKSFRTWKASSTN